MTSNTYEKQDHLYAYFVSFVRFVVNLVLFCHSNGLDQTTKSTKNTKDS
jgi:hypothetical protein